MRSFLSLTGALCVPFMSIHADLSVGHIYPISFVDVDGNRLSTADGRVTVVVLTTTADARKAQIVGDRVPDYCLGNPHYRMITVVNFLKRRSSAIRAIFRAWIRHRLDTEARRLQTRYTAKKISHDARLDVFAVPDFDGELVRQLGVPFEAADFRVFVFGRKGELLREWKGVPTARELAAVVK